MIVTLAQLNFTIGNFRGNLDKMKAAVEDARRAGSDLVIFSEMSVPGYPPLDFLDRKEFIDKCYAGIEVLRNFSKGIGIIAGAPTYNPQSEGKALYNSAYFMYDESILATVHKSLLPTYDIFDEYRHFEPNTEFSVIPFKGHRIALTICEDLWDEQPVDFEMGKSRLYTVSPMEELVSQNPDLIINIAASPFAYNRIAGKRSIFTGKAKKYGIPVLNVN